MNLFIFCLVFLISFFSFLFIGCSQKLDGGSSVNVNPTLQLQHPFGSSTPGRFEDNQRKIEDNQGKVE